MRTRTKLGSFFDSKHGDSESDCVHTVTAGWGGGGGGGGPNMETGNQTAYTLLLLGGGDQTWRLGIRLCTHCYCWAWSAYCWYVRRSDEHSTEDVLLFTNHETGDGSTDR